MVAASKPVVLQQTLLQLIGGRDCRDVVHPWTHSCSRASLRLLGITMAGMSRFVLPYYVAQVAVAGWRPDLSSAARSVARSLCFGSSLCTGVIAFHCLFRYLLGGYMRSTVIFWPSFFAGLSIYFEDERRKPIVLFYFFTWVLEWLFRRLATTWPAAGSRASLTLLFMATSAALMWTLRRARHPRDMPVFWFFRPSRRSGDIESSKGCVHQGTCWNHGFMLTAKYCAVGVALQVGRALLSLWRNRAGVAGGGRRGLGAALWSAACGDQSLALFLGAYVALYQAVRCGLCRLRGEDRSAHALLAGLASGAAFWLHPDLTIALAAVTTLLQLLAGHRLERRLLEPAAALCLCWLMYAALVDRPHCPSGVLALTDILVPGIIPAVHKRLFYLKQ